MQSLALLMLPAVPNCSPQSSSLNTNENKVWAELAGSTWDAWRVADGTVMGPVGGPVALVCWVRPGRLLALEAVLPAPRPCCPCSCPPIWEACGCEKAANALLPEGPTMEDANPIEAAGRGAKADSKLVIMAGVCMPGARLLEGWAAAAEAACPCCVWEDGRLLEPAAPRPKKLKSAEVCPLAEALVSPSPPRALWPNPLCPLDPMPNWPNCSCRSDAVGASLLVAEPSPLVGVPPSPPGVGPFRMGSEIGAPT